MKLRRLLLAMPLLASGAMASAAPLYVTDKITVGVFQAPDLQGEPDFRLSSGATVDLLERRGELARIRTEHGEQGWLRASFLVKKEPAALQLEQVKQEMDQLESNLESLQEENKGLKKLAAEARSAATLRAELAKQRKDYAALKSQLAHQPKGGDTAVTEDDQASLLQAQIDQLKTEKGDLEERLAAAVLIEGGDASDFDGSGSPAIANIEVRLPAVIVMVLLGILLGGALTYRWVDRRLMKRFGGIRFH